MSLPYYKRFPRDFFEGTIGMSFEVKCAYGLVLDMIYMRDGQLPDDARYIAGMLGCSVRKWNSILSELVEAGKLQCEGGIISNSRADYLVEERRTYRDKKAENRSRPNKNSDVETRSRSSARVKPEPEVSNSNELDLGDTPPEQPKRKAAPRGAARGTRISENWAPTPKDYAYASSKGVTPEEINNEAERFRNHWVSATGKGSTKRDWSAAWRNWIIGQYGIVERKRKAAERAASHTRRNGGKLSAFERLDQRLEAAAAGQESRFHDERDGGEGYVIDAEATRLAG